MTEFDFVKRSVFKNYFGRWFYVIIIIVIVWFIYDFINTTFLHFVVIFLIIICWMHNGFINVDGVKMAKSLHNFWTVRDISKKYDLEAVRMFMLSAHYRSPLNFSDDLMEAAKSGLDRIRTAAARTAEAVSGGAEGPMTAEEEALIAELPGFTAKFEAAMDDDMNTADAIAAVFELVRFMNTNVGGGSTKAFASAVKEVFDRLCDVLGLITEKQDEVLDADIERLIEERQAARKAKDYARADAIRDELAAKGIILEDTREGVKWKRS